MTDLSGLVNIINTISMGCKIGGEMPDVYRLYIDVLKRKMPIVACIKEGDVFKIVTKYDIYIMRDPGHDDTTGDVHTNYKHYFLRRPR